MGKVVDFPKATGRPDMTAEICKFPVAESEGDEIERLRARMREWHGNVYGGDTPLGTLVWHEVEAAMKSDDLSIVRNAAAALEELCAMRVSDVPF